MRREISTIMWRESFFLRRNPVPIATGFLTPLLWLILFGAVFKNLGNFPDFPAKNYITYLVPGIIVMNAVARGLISCFNLVWHRHYGFLDKILVSPISRSSIFIGQTLITLIFGLVEATAILIVGYVLGMHSEAGLLGIIPILAIYILLELVFIAFSLMMVGMPPEAYIGLINLLMLPPIFLSSALFPLDSTSKAVRAIARFNPVTYAADAMRTLILDGWEWSDILSDMAILGVVAVVMLFLSNRIFTRSVNKWQ